MIINGLIESAAYCPILAELDMKYTYEHIAHD